MKNKQQKFYLIVFILIFSGWINRVSSQVNVTAKEAGQLVERNVLVTDREIYCVNEDLHFSVWNFSSPVLREANWSNVLYVELVSPDGESFAHRKLNYTQDGTSGTLRIPESALTGNYYIRAYTRWMRDYSPYHYFYKMVTIINPYYGELMGPADAQNFDTEPLKRMLVASGGFRITPDKKSYNRHNLVNVEIVADQATGLQGKCFVAVVASGTEKGFYPALEGFGHMNFSPEFIPETRGLSISGKVVNASDSIPLPYTLVGLTVFRENPEIRNIMTNDKGQFYFDLSDLTGEYEIFISAKAAAGKSPLILVDNDFSSKKLELPWVPVDLSPKAKALYQTLIFNAQIQALYRQQKAVEVAKPFSSGLAFYGKPDFTLKLSDYIQLATVKDYFYELVPQVGVRREGKKSMLKVFGNYSELQIYDPLVMMDMVPIFDVDRVLAVQPSKLDRIEVVSTPYIRGDIVYGGVVSLFSKKGDLAGIDLPSAGRFITYDMLGADSVQVAPSPENKHVPDLQNCLYWNPAIELHGTNPARISFNAGDNAGEYVIVVRGFDGSGNVKASVSQISIK